MKDWNGEPVVFHQEPPGRNLPMALGKGVVMETLPGVSTGIASVSPYVCYIPTYLYIQLLFLASMAFSRQLLVRRSWGTPW